MLTTTQYMHHCLVMAIGIVQRGNFDSIEEKLFYTQLLRTLTPFHKLEELSLKQDLEKVEDMLYGEYRKHPGNDPPDSLGASQP